MKLQEGASTQSSRHREETILSSQQQCCAKQHQQEKSPGSFPAVLGREASNVQSIFRQASVKLGFGRGNTRTPARDGVHVPSARSSAAADSNPFEREITQEKKADASASTCPTRPAIACNATRSPREKRTALLGPRSSRGNAISPIRQLSRLLRFGGSGSSGSSCPAALPWQEYQGMSKSLNYRPKGHGRAFAESYDVGEVLGSGGFAAVLSGIYKPDGTECAVKVMDRKHIMDSDALVQEVAILRALNHPQVVRFLDFYEEPSTFYLVLERVPGGELFDRIVSVGRFGEADARACVRSLLEAVGYCHTQKIAHRDIKPENLLMASLDENDRTIKLADFGLARDVAQGPVTSAPSGTPSYMAPEALRLQPHGLPVDCWGVGVVVHILLGGYPPFCSSRQDKLFRLIKKGRVIFDDPCWEGVSHTAKDLILALLNVEPQDRLTVEQALRHPWLQETDAEAANGSDNLSFSLVKLKVFNAKQKFRMVINTLIACQQLHAFAASSMTSLDSTVKGPPEKRGKRGPSTTEEMNEEEVPYSALGIPDFAHAAEVDSVVNYGSEPLQSRLSSGSVPHSNVGSSPSRDSRVGPHVPLSSTERSQTVDPRGHAGGETTGISAAGRLPKSALRRGTGAPEGKEVASNDDSFGNGEGGRGTSNPRSTLSKRTTSMDNTPDPERVTSHQMRARPSAVQRQATGIFVEQEWRKSLARPSAIGQQPPLGRPLTEGSDPHPSLLGTGGFAAKEVVIERRDEEEQQEGEK